MRILLVDDHPIFRSGLRHLVVEAMPGAQVVEAGDVEQALQQLASPGCDMIVFDLGVPGGRGLDVLEMLRRRWPAVPVLALGMGADGPLAAWALRCGAAGYVSKRATLVEITTAVRRVATGGKYVGPPMAEKLAGRLAEPGPLHQALTKREFQVFLLLASGMPLRQIATRLAVTAKTCGVHRSRILEKLRLRTDADIVRYALEHGLVS